MTDSGTVQECVDFLPYGMHCVEEDDIAAVERALRSGCLTNGPLVESFERELARVVGARHVIACSSGTAALHLACAAAGLGPGMLSIVPSLTFLATANVSRFVGADVSLCDVDPDTGLVRREDVEESFANGAGLSAVFPVHMNGQVAAIEEISDLAREHGCAVIEDACHALGTRYRTTSGEWTTVGDCRFSDATVFSFHPVKTIAMGEGGAIATNDSGFADRARRLRNHGMVREPVELQYPEQGCDADGAANPWYYEMQSPGFNYRVSELHCALGLSQLAKLPRFAARRRELMRRYDEALAELPDIVRPVTRVSGDDPVLHLYPVFIKFNELRKSRARVMNELAGVGVGTQVHYLPLHRQPYYREECGELHLPGAERYYERVLSLPFFPAMADTDVDRVVGALRQVLEL